MAEIIKASERRKVVGLYLERYVINEIDKRAKADNRTRASYLTVLIKQALGLIKGGNE